VSDSGPVVVVNRVSRRVNSKQILQDISFEFKRGSLYTILGPSGAGKSSFLRLLNRLDEPTGGEVLFDGKPHCDYDPGFLRRKIGYLFQSAYLFPGTVRDNVLYANPAVTQEEMEALLSRSAMSPTMADSPVDNLSGGEAQRVALARMLATEPEVVLLDEPTSALDPTATSIIEKSIKRLVHEDGLAVLMVTHNPEQALRMGGETLLLVDGRLVEHGPSEKVINDPSSVEGRRYRDKELQ
jgi:putative ABC transport system ATP-binding protein